MSEIRDRIVAEARAVIGLCACKPWRSEFAKLLGATNGSASWEPALSVPFHCYQDSAGKWHTEGVSTCALVGFRGILTRAGVKTEADKRYRDGMVFADAARVLGAAAVQGDALRWITPDLGDALVIGSGIGTHWCTVVGWEGPGDAPTLVTVDAGQLCPHEREGGHQGLVTRPWGASKLQAVREVRRAWMYTAQGLPKLGDRLVQRWYSADAIPV